MHICNRYADELCTSFDVSTAQDLAKIVMQACSPGVLGHLFLGVIIQCTQRITK